MLHSAAPTSFNMFPFSQHPQHPAPGHHGEMFHPTANTHHHNHHSSQHHQQQQQEPPQRPRFLFKMPRVVPNQKEKFESDEFMKRHSREAEVRYTGYRDRPIHERQNKFLQAARDGSTEIAFVQTGFNIVLNFDTTANFNPAHRQSDFDREPGKIFLRAPLILNGVCVRWKGYLNLERLDGEGCLEFDDENALIEDAKLRKQVESYNRQLRELEEQSKARSRHLQSLVSSHVTNTASTHAQFPSHHHLQSDLLLEARKKQLAVAAASQGSM